VLPMRSLLGHQGMCAAQEYLRGQVAPQLATERTRYNDGLEQERLHTRRYIAATALACHHKLLTLYDWESERHENQYRRIKGENAVIPQTREYDRQVRY
jgi:hypothetical protein